MRKTKYMVVGVQGFEPWTPCSQSRCATRLRYTPTESIFYTEMAHWSKSCKICSMVALFLSKFRKQFTGAIALSFLVLSLLGTHWLGFAHGIAHSGIHHQNIELSCVDQAPTLGHGSVSCHLFDALTLAGFISSAPDSFETQIPLNALKPVASESVTTLIQVWAYQSRAPPSFIL